MAGKNVVELNKDNFEAEVVNFDGVVLVDFWAEWCGPCKMIAPIIDKLAEEYADNDKVKVAKLDTEESPELAEEYRVMGIPNVKVFMDKQVIDEVNGFIGPATEQVLRDKVENALNSDQSE